jgi:hypothetical protein
MYDGTNFQLLSDSNGTNETVGNLTVTGTLTAVDVTTTGNTILGNASTDTLNVGNGDLVKDASGNVGIGVTPSAWSSSYKAISVGFTGGQQLAGGVSNTQANLASNLVFTGTGATGWKLPNNVAGTNYEQYLGIHKWYNAPANGVNGDATLVQAMTLDASGNLLVGGRIGAVGRLAANSAEIDYQATSAITTAKDIMLVATGEYAGLVIVQGTNSAVTAQFLDLVAVSSSFDTVAVISSTTLAGSPAARTYTFVGNYLRLAMASGTYGTACTIIETPKVY